MFTTPKKQKQLQQQQQQLHSAIETKENNPSEQKSLINSNLSTITITNSTPKPMSTNINTNTNTTTIVFENGTMFGALTPADNANNEAKLSGTSITIPEIVISGSSSSNSLNRSHSDISHANSEENAKESTALLENTTTTISPNTTTLQSYVEGSKDTGEEPATMLQDEFDQFILNRTTSESNILESSIYSELQFPPSVNSGSIVGINAHNSSNTGSSGVSVGGGYLSSNGGTTNTSVTRLPGPQTPPHTRQTKRTKRKHKTKSKCSATAASLAAAAAAAGQRASPTHYPPRYTTIYMDPHHHNQYGNVMSTTQHHHHHHSAAAVAADAANAFGQIASAAASSPFLNAPVAADTAAYMQQFQYFQQRPMVTTMAPMPTSHHRLHR